ncbi:MAG: hypothetical protein ABW215_00330 [Kibdelosporangium sp.]
MVSSVLYICGMSQEHKRAWIALLTTVAGYGTYLVLVLGRSGDTPLTEAPYVAAVLWTIGGSIVVAIVLNIAVGISSPEDRIQDQRDREINQFGDHIGQSFLVIGGLAALVMAMAESSHFWIANVIYLGFTLSSILGSCAKIAAYRWGFQAG